MSEAALPNAYKRVFHIWADDSPLAAARARAALDVLLSNLRRSACPDAFQRSTLTRTGSPFEPAFSLIAPGLRYTVDPAQPETDLHQRLDGAVELLKRLQAPLPSPHFIDRLARLQAMGGLRYGAQIGARHDNATDRYKLYVELPPEAETEADALGTAWLGTPPVLNVPGRDARPTIIGIDLTSSRLEIYYRIEHLHPLEIGTLLSRANASQRAPEILAMLAQSQRLPICHELPGSTWGFSYARESDNQITFSLYTFALTLFGPDGRTRDRVLAMGRRHGWDLSWYASISQPLAEYYGFPCHHGIFGLVVRPGNPPAAWIGLAPPEAST